MTRWAMHEDMPMRVTARHVTLPNPQRDKARAKLPLQPASDVRENAIEIARARCWAWQRAWIRRKRHMRVERVTNVTSVNTCLPEAATVCCRQLCSLPPYVPFP